MLGEKQLLRTGWQHRTLILYHILFWLGYFLFNVIRWGSYFNDYGYSFRSNLVEFPIHIILVYVNIYYLFPKHVIRKKYTRYILSLGFFILLMSITRILLNYGLVTTEVWPESDKSSIQLFDLNYIISVYIGELYVVGLTSAIWFVIEKVKERDIRQQLEQEKLKAELSYLKSQIQPHFFFNTLNSLYALSLDKAESTPSMILKLSRIMNFVIYKGKETEVPLIDVIAHLNNYLELEKLRFGKLLNVDFEINGNMDGISIAPLICSSFVENAIKHGGIDEEGVKKLRIELTIGEEKDLMFIVRNKKKEGENVAGDHGIGLQNAMKRLELQYENNYHLEVLDEGEDFEISLTLKCER